MNAAKYESRTAWRRVLIADRSLPSEIVEAMWRDADALIRNGTMLKDGDRCTIVRLFADRFAGGLVLKRYNLRGPLHTIGHFVLRSRAAWSWRNGHLLADAGLSTPRPLAMLEERFGPLRLRSFLLMGFVSGVPLLDVVRSGRLDSAQLSKIADQFAHVWRKLGELRLGHGDMKATNFIVDDDGRLWLIDLDGMRRQRFGPMLARERRRDLERFMRNWRDHPEAAAAFRARLDKA